MSAAGAILIVMMFRFSVISTVLRKCGPPLPPLFNEINGFDTLSLGRFDIPARSNRY